MNFNFVRSKNKIIRTEMSGSHVLEICGSNYGSVYRAYDFDPAKNTVCEIFPEIKKYNFISVVNCIYESSKYYFASYSGGEDKINISVYEYDLEDSLSKRVFEFCEDKVIADSSNKVKIFVLSPTKFLIQTEILTPEESHALMGAISFSLVFYDSETGVFSDVDVDDFKNNGICTIIPVSESRIMIKCGYSFIEDERFNMLSEKEALIESIYFTNSAQLIADIMLNQPTGNMKLIDTAYFEKCIVTPRVKDGYIYYETVDLINRTVDINFVNANTFEKFTFRKDDINDEERQISPVVISGVPYIKTSDKKSERFLNLLNGLEDMEFIDESFLCAYGSVLFFKRIRKGKNKLRIYSYPHINLIYEENYIFKDVCGKDDEYYIYIE